MKKWMKKMAIIGAVLFVGGIGVTSIGAAIGGAAAGLDFLMVLGVMLSGFWAADALDHMRKEILQQEGKRRGWWS